MQYQNELQRLQQKLEKKLTAVPEPGTLEQLEQQFADEIGYIFIENDHHQDHTQQPGILPEGVSPYLGIHECQDGRHAAKVQTMPSFLDKLPGFLCTDGLYFQAFTGIFGAHDQQAAYPCAY